MNLIVERNKKRNISTNNNLRSIKKKNRKKSIISISKGKKQELGIICTHAFLRKPSRDVAKSKKPLNE